MPTPKLLVKQFKDKNNKVYLMYRYWDDNSNNFEYQVYELVTAKEASRNLGSPEKSNTRQMCDWVWNNVSPIDE